MWRERMRRNSWRLAVPFWMLVVAAVGLGVFQYLSIYTEAPREEYWDYTTGAWEAFTEENGVRTPLTLGEWGLVEGLTDPDQTIYVSTMLDEDVNDGEMTPEINLQYWYVAVFLEEGLLYTDQPGSGEKIGEIEFPGPPDEENGPWQLGTDRIVELPLPPGSGGKRLTLAVGDLSSIVFPQEEGAAPEGHLPSLYRTSRTKLLQRWWSVATEVNYPTAALAATGLILCGMFLLRLYLRQEEQKEGGVKNTRD